MIKALKIRLYPNTEQASYIDNLLGSYRFVYNKCLNHKITAYTEHGKSIGLKELGNYFHQDLTKNPEYEWLNQHNTKVLKQSVINLLDSYKRFFVNGNGFPKYKSRKDNLQSCRFPIEAISRKNTYINNKISLTSQLKDVKFKTSDKYIKYLSEYKSNIKSATLTKSKSGNYHLSILIELPCDKQLPQTDKVIGLDLGIKEFIVTSDNQSFENLKIKRNNKKKLVKLNRSLSRKQNKSNNKTKARIKLAKYYEKLNNKKENYLHLISNQLLNENQVIVIEDLNVKGMLKNHCLAKSIQELSLYRFKQLLTYKSDWYGRDLIEIDRWFPSSKTCSCCGYKNNDLTLKDRTFKCPECHMSIDRDYNAAINIRNEGIKLLNNKIPIRNGELTPTEISGYTVVDVGRKSLTSFL
ncbi:MAG: RNA-guided endonuclease InsQ/TnpB family protein [bacterium]